MEGENIAAANSLSQLDMSDNKYILNISEIYGYDRKKLPDSAYSIFYHNIAKAQKTDAKLQQKLVSHKDYTLDNFRGDDQNHHLICQNSKICLPTELQKKTEDWYHDMLCNPGETHTGHNLCQHFYCKILHTTIHNVCKKCPTCQRAKKTNQKYGKLPHKKAETNPWDTICVDLIGPCTIPQKRKTPLKFLCLTMIDPATSWFDMKQIPNKMAAEIADIAEKTLFPRY